MLSRFNFVLGLILLVAAVGVFIGIGRYAVPRLLNDSSQIAECAGADCFSGDAVAQIAPTDAPTATPIPPTATSTVTALPTATSIPPTAQPATETIPATETALPTEPPTATSTTAPTATSVPSDTATPTPDGPTPTPSAPLYRASRDAALFAEAGGLGGRTGYYVPTGQSAWVFGRSADSRWLHVAHLLGDQGWAAAGYFSITRGQLVALPVSDFIGEGDPNVTVRATQVAQLQPTATQRLAFPTPRPTNTPWPTSTPRSNIIVRPTNTPWPTNTPRANAPRPTATWVIPTPFPTNTPFPTPMPSTGGGNSGGATTNAIAWWQVDQPSVLANGNGTWRANIVVRVPTSFQYTFNMPFLSTQRLRDRNLDGDDFFLLSTSGMPCGSPLNAELIVRQNGARMIVSNEFTLQEGPVIISAPC